MSDYAGPLYESTFFVERGHAAQFDLWLDELLEKALREPGIVDARIIEIAGDDGERRGRICQFRCRDDHAIDRLLDDFFIEAEADAADAFGNALDLSGRVLRQDDSRDLPPAHSPDCLNCGTRLRGQYCGNCGQRSRSRLISLWELISDAFGDLFEFDSRLWQTLIPLLIRPGQLTRDYLEGRRARYMPPFRTYLVLSVIFFVVAFFNPRDDLGLLFEPEPEPSPEEVAEKEAAAADARQEVLDELAAEGIIVGEMIPEEDLEDFADVVEADSGGLNIQIDEETGECIIDANGLSEMPEWLQKRLTPERLKRVCERIGADDGKTFIDLLLDNIPVALIVLMPLMALVLKILYPLSRRYFVEHLLFFVHYHAFFFLILTLEIAFASVSELLPIPGVLTILAIVAASLYIPVYLYLAMRRVYGQGHILTFIKYVALLASYMMGATLTLLGAVLFALAAV